MCVSGGKQKGCYTQVVNTGDNAHIYNVVGISELITVAFYVIPKVAASVEKAFFFLRSWRQCIFS